MRHAAGIHVTAEAVSFVVNLKSMPKVTLLPQGNNRKYGDRGTFFLDDKRFVLAFVKIFFSHPHFLTINS